VTEHVIPDFEEFSMRLRPPGRVHRFAQSRGNRQVPRGFVKLVIGRGSAPGSFFQVSS
jgi:hypothetical protein